MRKAQFGCVNGVARSDLQNNGKKMGIRTNCGTSFSCPYFLAVVNGEQLSHR